MRTLSTVALFPVFALAVAGAGAQMPAPNPMPDGSSDMYAGLGLLSAPRYAGADQRRTRPLPVLQGQWSNGVFVSGMSAGLHLSARPLLEYGPLVSLHPGRDDGGNGASAIGIQRLSGEGNLPRLTTELVQYNATVLALGNRLNGLPAIARRLQGGGFANVYLAPALRLTSRALYGAGNDHRGATFQVGIQALNLAPLPHHSLTVEAEVSMANRYYNQAFFGIDNEQSVSSGHPLYQAQGGWRDARIGARWNWTLTPSWLLVSGLDVTRQLGTTRTSPLVTRNTGVSVSTALALRF
ncbi:MipA/OmpV family protein [Massilia sp. S19_KUP03_FR1]|uniref:MipA/OmpV family protein n=1 Tax=Massilia sp. S19_KUP03_FR1 TaxID=3025503 RepID=UPI002FCCDAE7